MSTLFSDRHRALRPLLAVSLAAACIAMAACDRRPADPAKPSTDSGMTPVSTSVSTSVSSAAMPPVAPVPASAPLPSPSPASGTMR